MNRYNEETLAELLRMLPPAPEAWVRAAQELAPSRAALDELVARAEADARYREELIANLEQALEQAGIEPNPTVVETLKQRLDA